MFNKTNYKNEEREELQAREQILYNLVQILDSFPQYKISQHLIHILRKKTDSEDPYIWSNRKLLSKFEKYIDELDSDLSTEINVVED